MTFVRSRLDRLFRAQRVAVIGASASRPAATGNQMIRTMLAGRSGCEIIPVSATADRIEGLATVAALEDLPPIDVAVVAVGARGVVAVVDSLERLCCPVAVVVSVGLSAADVRSLAEVHGRGVTAVHGPNCMGVIDVGTGLSLWADEGNLTSVAAGPISLISQSGSGAIFVVRSLDQSGFSKVISSGNETGLTTADYVDWLAADPTTSTIGLVVESIPNGAHFAAAIGEAHRAGKRVAALKVGRTAQGALATVAHTGALVSDDDAYAALFARVGVPLADDYDELAAMLQVMAVAGRRRYAPNGGSIGVVTISGGQAALTADIAAAHGVATPAFSAATVDALRNIDGAANPTNPFDAAAGPAATDDDFRNAVEVIAADPNIGAVLVVLDAQATLSDAELHFEDEYFQAVTSASVDVPLIVASSSAVSLHPARLAEHTGPVPLVRGIGNAVAGIRALLGSTIPAERERPGDLPDQDEVAVIARELSARTGPVDSELAYRLAVRYGLPLTRSIISQDVETAKSWAQRHGYPVVLKVVSQDVAHRSDIGGVELGVQDATHLERAWASIHANVAAASPAARIDGIEIQPHLADRVEAFVGFVCDSRLGATVGIGMGGVLVELLDDAARAAAPLSIHEAEAAIGTTRLGRLLAGYRSLYPNTDLRPLATLLVRASWLAHDFVDLLAEGDLNPVLIEPGSGDVRIVDALFVSASHAHAEPSVAAITPARSV